MRGEEDNIRSKDEKIILQAPLKWKVQRRKARRYHQRIVSWETLFVFLKASKLGG